MSMSTWRVLVGDCLEHMRRMDADSVAAIVTDPPYGLTSARTGRSQATEGAVMRGFMGLEWDGSVPPVEVWREALRVLRPGGRLLAFAGTRTMHRMWCAIEDAGFVIEDSIAWIYGSGFPKHRSKLKPAYEPICVARKGPVSELNIDECRIGVTDADRESRERLKGFNNSPRTSGNTYANGKVGPADDRSGHNPAGRWPANVMLDEEAAAALDAQSGTLRSGEVKAHHMRNSSQQRNGGGYRGNFGDMPLMGYGDSGGASRFFYIAKASRSEREAGLDEPSLGPGDKARRRPIANHHPTVKPVALMRELVRLVTPTGGVVLDPFAGSGTTGIACIHEERDFIGVELSPEYADIARRRIGHAAANHEPTLFDDGAA